MPLYIAAILVMIVVDQMVKHWAFTVLQPQHTIPLIENVFHLTYIENRGAAFSMFAKFDSRWIFVALAAVITLAICYALSKKLMQTALGSWSLVLIAAGAVGNAVDRVARGFVTCLIFVLFISPCLTLRISLSASAAYCLLFILCFSIRISRMIKTKR